MLYSDPHRDGQNAIGSLIAAVIAVAIVLLASAIFYAGYLGL